MDTNQNASDEMSAEDLAAISDRVAAHFREGGTLGDLAGITDEQFEAMYALAYRLYGMERYEDASKVFAYLGLNDPYDARYTMGLGACHQMLKQWDQAIVAYTLAVTMASDNPMPAFHLAECVAGKGDLADAQALLTELAKRCTQAEHQALKKKIDAMIQLLEMRTARAKAGASDKS